MDESCSNKFYLRDPLNLSIGLIRALSPGVFPALQTILYCRELWVKFNFSVSKCFRNNLNYKLRN